MLTSIAAVLWPLVVAYGLWRFAQVAERFAPKVEEKREPVIVPDDLVGWAQTYPDQWAQDDAIRVITEKYAMLRDWNKVRVAVGLAGEPKP